MNIPKKWPFKLGNGKTKYTVLQVSCKNIFQAEVSLPETLA